jgi:valyl-tRNA synthetase
MTARFPRVEDFPSDPSALDEVAELQEVITEVRRIRAEMELSPKVRLSIVTADTTHLERNQKALLDLAGIAAISRGTRGGPSATAVVRNREIYIPLEGAVDLDAERSRLDKEIAKAQKDLAFLVKRLENPGFVGNAPPALLDETRSKRDAAQDRVERLQRARAAL